VSKEAATVVSGIAAARKAVQLYPPSHPAFKEAMGGFRVGVARATENGPLRLNLHEGHLYQESKMLPEDTIGQAQVADAFESHGIESVSIQPAFGEADAIALLQVLTMRPTPDFNAVDELESRGAKHVSFALLAKGDVESVKEHDEKREADRAMYQRIGSAFKALSTRMVDGKGVDLEDTSRLVAGLIARLAEDQPAILTLATIRGQTDRALFHSLNVMIYAVALGRHLGLPEADLRTVGISALLHDVGKTAFDAEDPHQQEAMRRLHPRVGAEILARLATNDPAPMLVAYEHHMYLNGSGWPEREPGRITHPYSRMIQVADRFENLTSSAEGAEAMTPDRAMVQIMREAGHSLDPLFSRLFAGAIGVFPTGSMVRLSDQSVGLVTRAADPLRPFVRLIYDSKGGELTVPFELDMRDADLRIVEVIDPQGLDVIPADKV